MSNAIVDYINLEEGGGSPTSLERRIEQVFVLAQNGIWGGE